MAWRQGRDPEPKYEESLRLYEELLQSESKDPDRYFKAGHAGYLWLDHQTQTGKDVSAVLARALAPVEAGLLKWPKDPFLLECKADLLIASLHGHIQGRPLARDPRQREAAFHAVADLMRIPHHRDFNGSQAWLHLALAEAGDRQSATQAFKYYEADLRKDPDSGLSITGAFRALLVRGGEGDLARMSTLCEALIKTSAKDDPEVLLYRAILYKTQGLKTEFEHYLAQALQRQPGLVGHPLLNRK
jgi:tetratricopeptide (TPR) repeat protein